MGKIMLDIQEETGCLGVLVGLPCLETHICGRLSGSPSLKIQICTDQLYSKKAFMHVPNASLKK